MFKDMVAVMDFGSSKITVLVGVKEVNNSFKLLASADCEYDGFANGEFIDPNNLRDVMSEAILNVEKQLECKIKSLFVGVPAEFCFVTENTITKIFPKKTKLTLKVINNLFLEDTEENPYKSHSVINKAPLYYIVNDDNRVNDPLGIIANKIQVKCGYVLVENKFKLLISGILDTLNIKEYDFVSNTIVEGVYLIDETIRNEGCVLIDCGYITTSVAQILGDGLSGLKSFSLGGGLITSDISRVLEISFDEAEELKRQAVITLKPSGVDYYQVGDKKFNVKTVNEIILARLDKIVETIKLCIDGFELKLPDYTPLYFTGGGLNYIEGITDYLRKEFGRPIELVAPKALLYRKPDLSSSISLLNMTINLYK